MLEKVEYDDNSCNRCSGWQPMCRKADGILLGLRFCEVPGCACAERSCQRGHVFPNKVWSWDLQQVDSCCEVARPVLLFSWMAAGVVTS